MGPNHVPENHKSSLHLPFLTTFKRYLKHGYSCSIDGISGALSKVDLNQGKQYSPMGWLLIRELGDLGSFSSSAIGSCPSVFVSLSVK